MKKLSRLFALVTALCIPTALFSQALPTARRTVQFAAFGLVTGTYTGLSGGRNLGVTLGADVGFYNYRSVLFSAEVRGTYPLKKGQVDGQKSILGGLRIDRRFGPAVVFGDALAGRGAMEYVNGGYIVPPLVYYSSTTNVYGGGLGAEVDVKRGFALKAEGQVQHWEVPFTSAIYSKQVNVGVVYRFGAGGRPLLGVRD